MIMNGPFKSGALAAVLTLMIANSCAALTAETLWSELQRMAGQSGQTINVQNTIPRNGALRLEGIEITSPAQASGRTTTLFEEMDLVEESDGTVRIVVPDSYRIVFDPTERADQASAVIDVRTQNLSGIASGEPGDLRIAYAADSAELKLTEYQSATDVDDVEFVATVSTLAMTNTLQERTRALDGAFGSADVRIDAFDPEQGIRTAISIVVTEPGLETRRQIPEVADGTPPPPEAQDYTLRSKHAGMEVGVVVESPDYSSAIALTVQSGETRSEQSGERVSLTSTSDTATLFVGTPQLPTGFSASFDRATVSGSVPLDLTKDAPARLTVDLASFAIAEEVWALVDPNGILDHEPANLFLDITGQSHGEGATDLGRVDIQSFALSLLGASLNMTGGFDIDPEGYGLVPGAPAMSGKMSLSATGVQGLLSQAGELGVLQPAQLSSIQLMLGFFARPGTEPDTLTSEIEVTRQGGLIANGMQLR